MNPFQDAGPSRQANFEPEDQMSATPGRKRVGWHEEHPVRSQQSPEDTGSGGHNTPLERSDVSHDDLQKIRASLRLALGDEHLPEEVIQEPIAAPKDVQKPRPAIRSRLHLSNSRTFQSNMNRWARPPMMTRTTPGS